MKYFVLKPKGDDPFAEASREAMKTYADTIEDEDREFALDLRAWAEREQYASDIRRTRQR